MIDQYNPDAVASPERLAAIRAARERIAARDPKGKAFEGRVQRHLLRFKRLAMAVQGKAYNEDQPRVPAGSPEGGQFGSGGSMVAGESLDDRKARAITVLTRNGDPLTGPDSTWKLYDPETGIWSPPGRQTMHDQIVSNLIAQAQTRGVPNDYKAIIAGGLGGAGKTSVFQSDEMAKLGIDTSQYLTVNPDDIKGEMAKLGMIPTADGLTPMECSPWVHEEASQIAIDLATSAQSQGMNVLWDITMSSQGSGENRLASLAWSGYQTQGVFVDVPPEQSLAAADSRYEHGMSDFANGQGYGGRVLTSMDPSTMRDPAGSFRSSNASNFMANTQFMTGWAWFDNTGFNRRLMATGGNLTGRS